MDGDSRADPVAQLGGEFMSKSVLDAIREGYWDYEPERVDSGEFPATHAIPGTKEKLRVMAERVRAGLPIWNDHDRADYEDPNE